MNRQTFIDGMTKAINVTADMINSGVDFTSKQIKNMKEKIETETTEVNLNDLTQTKKECLLLFIKNLDKIDEETVKGWRESILDSLKKASEKEKEEKEKILVETVVGEVLK